MAQTVRLDRLVTQRRAHVEVALPDFNDRAHTRIDIEIDVFARILGAQVNNIAVDKQPPGLVLREFIENKADNSLAIGQMPGL